jgi:hypothetical protein
MTGREKEIVRHLSEDDLDRLLTETDSEKVSKRLTFIKRLYKGASLEDAADDVGMSQSTGSRWARLWNKGGLGLLTPSFGGVDANLVMNLVGIIQHNHVRFVLVYVDTECVHGFLWSGGAWTRDTPMRASRPTAEGQSG